MNAISIDIFDKDNNDFVVIPGLQVDDTDSAAALADCLKPRYRLRYMTEVEATKTPRKTKTSKAKPASTAPTVCRGAADKSYEHGPAGKGRAGGFCKACVDKIPAETRQKVVAEAKAAKTGEKADKKNGKAPVATSSQGEAAA